MSRAESMATIQAALATQDSAEATRTMPTEMADTALLMPTIAPGVEAPAPITGAITKKPAEKPKKEQSEEEKLKEQQQKEEQTRFTDFRSNATRTGSALSGILNGAGVRLAGLPTPGSLMLPLIILLIFFMLLLPVNGHTRFVWLWMVLTGDASIGQTSGSTPDVAGGTATGTNPGGTTSIESPALPGNTVAILAPSSTIGYGSYVEEVS